MKLNLSFELITEMFTGEACVHLGNAGLDTDVVEPVLLNMALEWKI